MNFYDFLSEIFDEEVREDSVLNKFDSYDSYSILEIISMAEDRYDVEINGNDIRKCATAHELYDYIVSISQKQQG